MSATSSYVSPDWKPTRVLPTNGKLPDDHRQPRYHPYNRIGRLRAFRDEQTAYDSGVWLQAVLGREFNRVNTRAEEYCQGIGLDLVAAGAEGSGPTGGYILPAPVSSAIIDVKEKVGVSRQVCRVLPATSDSLTVPRRTNGLTVYYPGESGTITDSDKDWSQVSLYLKKRACLHYMSNELVEDAIIPIVDDIFNEMGHALALQEDNELINGNGTSTYGGVNGLLNKLGSAGVSTAATGHNTWGELDMADMLAAVGKLQDKYFDWEPGWVCSFAFFNQVMVRLAYAAGGVTAAEVMAGTGNVRSFAGYPVYLTSKMPTATAVSTVCALFGAFGRAAILADRGGVRIARSDDIKFAQDQTALRAVSRYDINVFDPGDTSDAGAYVGLKTAS